MEGLFLGAMTNFCANTHKILSLVGWVLTIFKIAIPVIIIIIGLVDLGKAAVSSKPEEIKKSVGSLLWRLVGGIAIFFVPTIVLLIFGWATNLGSATDALGKSTVTGESQPVPDWEICKACILSPNSHLCKDAVGEYDDIPS